MTTTQTTFPLQVCSRVAGKALPSSRTYDVYDPYTEEVLAAVSDGGESEVESAVGTAVDAAASWSQTPLDVRRRVLTAAADYLSARRDRLVDLAIRDTGAPVAIARELQVDAAIARLRAWAARSADTLALPAPAPANGLTGRVRRVPVGVVGCISPYNFPLLAMVGKVAPALFAGNAVVMKPAPQDPLLVYELTLALEAGLAATGAPPGVVNLVTGAGAEPGRALVEHPEVGAISFTGSTQVGTEIYRSSAPGMKRLLLELGGKGAMIVRRDADLDAVVAAATRTWTVHAGQVCLTTARVLVDRVVHDELVERLGSRLATLRYGDPRDPATDVGPVISTVQRDRVAALVSAARSEGATVHQAEGLPERGWFHPATLLTDCRPEQTAMQEEAFGPLLCVMATASDAEAVEIANATRYGLSDYVFTRDAAAAEAVAARLRSAQVGVNTVARHPDLPFGGNRASGLGRSGGTYALEIYTNLQAVATREGTLSS